MIKKNRKQRRVEYKKAFNQAEKSGCGFIATLMKDIPCGESIGKIETIRIDRPHTIFI